MVVHYFGNFASKFQTTRPWMEYYDSQEPDMPSKKVSAALDGSCHILYMVHILSNCSIISACNTPLTIGLRLASLARGSQGHLDDVLLVGQPGSQCTQSH
jgi:hypothetical protein